MPADSVGADGTQLGNGRSQWPACDYCLLVCRRAKDSTRLSSQSGPRVFAVEEDLQYNRSYSGRLIRVATRLAKRTRQVVAFGLPFGGPA